MSNIIKVKCIKHLYPDKTIVELCGLEFTLGRGERVVILGPNGAGKTTLIMHILGLLKPMEGEVEVLGFDPYKNFDRIRGKIGVVFQNVDEQIIGPTVYDDIAFGLRNKSFSRDSIDDKVNEIAKQLGISHLLSKLPHYLSGGEKKKVALAGALVIKPEVLILDEPFDNLDTKSKDEMVSILQSINKNENTSMIITTHDIDTVPDIAETVYVINDGHIVTKGSPMEILCNDNLLKTTGLKPPILIDLFNRLRSEGYRVTIPRTIDEGIEELKKLLGNEKKYPNICD